MKEIGTTEVRKVLEEILIDNPILQDDIAEMSDEQLLKANLRYDFRLDSLDFEEMYSELYNLYDINIDTHDPLIEHPFQKEETVENFIDLVNFCLNRNV